jgi:hypothetical protein
MYMMLRLKRRVQTSDFLGKGRTPEGLPLDMEGGAVKDE